MKMYRFPEKKIWKAVFVIYLFAMLLVARDTMITGAILSVETATLVSLGLMILGGLVFLAVNRKNLKAILLDRRMLAVAVSTVVILLPMLVKWDWQLMYFSVLMCLYFAIFLTYFVSLREVAKIFILIIAALGVHSLLATYILKPMVEAELFQVPVIANSANSNFYNFGLTFCFKRSWAYYRNFGLFREPGVYQFFIIVALYLNNYTVSWDKAWKLWTVNGILAVTMLSTFATGGVIELGLLAVVVFIDRKLYKDKKIRLISLALIGILLLIVVYAVIKQNMLYRFIREMVVKLFNFSPTSTGGVRFSAVITDFILFVKNPIFGGKLAVVLHSVDHNSTSTLLLYAVWGFLGGTLNVAAWVALVWEKERKVWVNLALLLVLFMSFNTQNLIADVFFWLFPMMALVERGLPLMKLRKREHE